MKTFLLITFGQKKEPKNWDLILSDYYDLTQDSKSTPIFSLYKEINFLENKIYLAKSILLYYKSYNGLMASNLILLFPKYRFTKETFEVDCKRAYGDIKTMQINVNDKKTQLNNLQIGEEKNKTTMYDWELQFTALSKYQGYRIDPNVITIAEYCAILTGFKTYVKEIENQNKLNNGK